MNLLKTVFTWSMIYMYTIFLKNYSELHIFHISNVWSIAHFSPDISTMSHLIVARWTNWNTESCNPYCIKCISVWYLIFGPFGRWRCFLTKCSTEINICSFDFQLSRARFVLWLINLLFIAKKEGDIRQISSINRRIKSILLELPSSTPILSLSLSLQALRIYKTFRKIDIG